MVVLRHQSFLKTVWQSELLALRVLQRVFLRRTKAVVPLLQRSGGSPAQVIRQLHLVNFGGPGEKHFPGYELCEEYSVWFD